VGDFCNGLKVRDVVTWVSNGLNVDSLGAVVNGCGNVIGLVAPHELGGDSQAR
jgi:hypothetical protein